jgi:SAM-dependent methyltransferase
METDSYRVLSRYYDAAYASKADLQDVPFYVALAERLGGPVLEIGCGTGRVLLEVASQGIEIEGLDSSEDQLQVFQGKLDAYPRAVRDRVRLHHADMRDFALDRRFPLITAPFRPLQHLYTIHDQIAAFRAIRKHLLPDGRFAFDAFYPKFQALEEDMLVERPDLQWADPLTPIRTIRRFFMRQQVDKLNQVFSGEFIFRIYEGEALIAEEREPLRLSYYTYPQFLLLFELCGFRILEEYGSFSGEPIGICREMIFVLGCA